MEQHARGRRRDVHLLRGVAHALHALGRLAYGRLNLVADLLPRVRGLLQLVLVFREQFAETLEGAIIYVDIYYTLYRDDNLL